jgi:hypothetical protein
VVPLIARLHLIFGGLGLVALLLFGSMHLSTGLLLFTFVGRTPSDAEQEKIRENLRAFIEQNFPAIRPIEAADQGLNLLLCVLLLVSAVGLLRWEAWGRKLSILYAVLGIGSKVFTVVFAYTIIWPLLREYLRGLPVRGDADEAFINMLGTFLTVVPFFAILFVIYPLVVLFVMLSGPVIVAFGGPAPREEEKDPYARFRPSGRSGPHEPPRPGQRW